MRLRYLILKIQKVYDDERLEILGIVLLLEEKDFTTRKTNYVLISMKKKKIILMTIFLTYSQDIQTSQKKSVHRNQEYT